MTLVIFNRKTSETVEVITGLGWVSTYYQSGALHITYHVLAKRKVDGLVLDADGYYIEVKQ